jgi:hypothetical protein
MNLNLNANEVIRRTIKYLVEGFAVAVAAFYIPRKKMNLEEVAMIAVTAAATLAILDLLAPQIGTSARQGAGFGIGASMVGFAVPRPGIPVANM